MTDATRLRFGCIVIDAGVNYLARMQLGSVEYYARGETPEAALDALRSYLVTRLELVQVAPTLAYPIAQAH